MKPKKKGMTKAGLPFSCYDMINDHRFGLDSVGIKVLPLSYFSFSYEAVSDQGPV